MTESRMGFKYESKKHAGVVGTVIQEDNKFGTVILQFEDGTTQNITKPSLQRWWRRLKDTADAEPADDTDFIDAVTVESEVTEEVDTEDTADEATEEPAEDTTDAEEEPAEDTDVEADPQNAEPDEEEPTTDEEPAEVPVKAEKPKKKAVKKTNQPKLVDTYVPAVRAKLDELGIKYKVYDSLKNETYVLKNDKVCANVYIRRNDIYVLCKTDISDFNHEDVTVNGKYSVYKGHAVILPTDDVDATVAKIVAVVSHVLNK